MKAIFCEPKTFLKSLEESYGSPEAGDEAYRMLQITLMDNPDIGDVIPGAGGVRKLRWPGRSHGKRGGIRFIYLFVPEHDRFLMLFAYAKGDRVDLTADERTSLAAYAAQYKEYLRRQQRPH